MSFSHKFAISGVWLYPSDGYQEQPIPTIGYTLNKRAVNQGYGAIIFTWTLLNQEKFTSIWNAWTTALTAGETRVQFSYVDKATGEVVEAWGTMHEPVVGARHTVFYDNVALRISHISDEQ